MVLLMFFMKSASKSSREADLNHRPKDVNLYFQLQSSALPTELSRDALIGRKIRRHKVVPGTDMHVCRQAFTYRTTGMTLILIDLRSVCVFALRNNMLNGKMCSIGGCKRTQA